MFQEEISTATPAATTTGTGTTTPAAAPATNALQSLSTRQYLDQTVVPILLQALGALAKERPADPIDFVVNFLQKEKSRFPTSGVTENA